MNQGVRRDSVRWSAKIAAGTLLLSCVASMAQRAAFGTLEWVNRTGTVSGTETIPVQFRLTLDPASIPLTIGPPNTGVPISGLGQFELDFLARHYPNYTIEDSQVNTYITCGGTFSSGCDNGPPYGFAFSSPVYDTSFSPEVPTILEHGQFIPDPIPAPAGTYFLFSSGVFLEVNGSYRDPISDSTTPFRQSFGIAGITCEGPDTSCAFERTVLAPVPLPGAIWLFGSGLVGVIALARRRMSV